jgi:hypothetical protein
MRTLYHGTTKQFGAFKATKNKPGLQYGFGIHFTVDPKFAKLYAVDQKTGRLGRIIEAKLAIAKLWDATRIIRTEAPEFQVILALFKGTGRRPYISDGQTSMNLDGFDNRRIQRVLREHGYDGIRYKSRHSRGMLKIAEAISYVVFEPEQVRIIGETDLKRQAERSSAASDEWQLAEIEAEVGLAP